MDILKAEIERKKRLLDKNKDLLAPNKKYFKRGDLSARQEEEYWSKHQRLVKDPNKSEATDSHDSGDEHRKKEEEKGTKIMPRKDVIRRLRERNEPIMLFGETDQEAFERLKKLEASEPDFNIGGGYANDFKAAMDQVDQDYYAEIMKSVSTSASQATVSVKDDGTTKEDIEKMKEVLGKGDNDKNQEIILKYLKFVLKEWGDDINRKSEEEKRSFKGKVASAMHAQTVSYMKPMFRKLKHKSMQEDILECLVGIIGYMLEKEYNKARVVFLVMAIGNAPWLIGGTMFDAHDAYLEMAIGNAPWPIGVTMVGIHARTGREKISSRYVAHVLNDETQRKYIQGLKRIMTQAQLIFPTDPSKSYMFEPIHH